MKDSALQVSVANLSEVGRDLTLALEEDWFRHWQEEDPHLEFVGPGSVVAAVHLSRHGRDILLRGHLKGTVTLACSRCLEAFALPVIADFDLLLVPGPRPLSTDQEELTAADLDLDFYSGDLVNLEDFLREQVLLALPLKPLCLETCRGLCPHCGVNLNKQSCTCQESQSSSPFAALAKLKV